MERFFYKDPAGGDREICDTLDEALRAAEISIGYYRQSARDDTEWMLDVEDVAVGTVAESGDEDDDIVTHRATAFGNDEDGYDYRMEAIEASPSPRSDPATPAI